MKREWRFSEQEVRSAVADSMSFAEALRRLGLCPTGGNWKTLRRYAVEREIQTDHFDPYAASRGPRHRIPLEQILVEGSTYSRNHLKARLYEARLKVPVCELCGQGEQWLGRRLSMILDHINGVRDDNRIENLRVVCPNCAATVATRSSNPATAVRGSARAIAQFATRGVRALILRRGRSCDRRMHDSCARSRRRTGRPSAGSTECRTTPYASGSGPTSVRRRRPSRPVGLYDATPCPPRPWCSSPRVRGPGCAQRCPRSCTRSAGDR